MNIKRFTVGNPINCHAVVKDIKSEDITKLTKVEIEDKSLIVKLEDEDIVYGLGENVRGINKRGWIFESYCSDDPNHAQDKRSLYGAHNFILISGKEKLGIYIDCPSKVVFDIGYTNLGELKITVVDGEYNLYIINGDTESEITKSFRKLIGQSYVPPKWAFGYQQSRWSYKDEDEVRELAKNFRDKEIPIDCIYLDIDYMERFKNFTLNKESFPNFDKLVVDMKKDGIKLIPIIDAGCKIEKGYEIYEEGIEKGHYCKDEDGKPFVAAVWPGQVHFPDFLDKDARLWFGSKYKFLVDKGIEGFWNDMNEPAIFYSEQGLKKAFDKIEEYKGKNLDIYSFFELKDTILGLSNSNNDYNSFYHNVDGKKVKHNDIHNLYGYNMTKSAAEGLEKINENKRFLLFSRASAIGAHRYGGIWTGDNTSLWEHLEMNVKMMPNLNMCGYMYTGADTGGFGGNCTPDLLTRWMQWSIFTPLLRNHSAMGTRNQEPFAYDLGTEKSVKNLIDLRYALVPYIYSEFMKATLNDDMMFEPLGFKYSDSTSRTVEDQLLMGDSLMLAPIYKQNSKGRYVYLPEEMLMVKIKNIDEMEFEVMPKGHHYFEANLDEFVIFIKKDKMLPLGKTAKSVESLNNEKLKVIAFVNEKANYNLYDDDGISKDYKTLKADNLSIEIKSVGNDLKVETVVEGKTTIKELEITAILSNGEVRKINHKI
ncbi:alpha-glucosidase [Clostridium gasigenes]|uniref:glycoside hydrolase family 31 protein n=1 Tax=Clostridium gasigenes TaxID=94869 RepID=UPI001C0B0615|nr:TIM-barrel domain-containing protein [Clostridium gasigenes]MBU3137723.1 alpha-glucosidase [Clostridium gasigenes]